ncbi:MAG: aminotransferase class IV [Proteobacteria bacterium]|jgi:branched-chain amino acid aminotransferase|nr:aminotransferase class IV [Pseudomonadota bacterium]
MQACSINGVLCTSENAHIPVNDHGFLYGDGVFEGLRFYNGRILKRGAHLQRLKNSARALSIPMPMETGALNVALDQLIEASNCRDGYIRLIVTRGSGPLGIDPRHCKAGNVVMIADQLSMVSDSVRELGARLIIASTRRLAGDQLDARIKSLNYLNQIMARLEANDAGADEAVVLNRAGYVAEGTADNLFIVQSGKIITPPVTDGALEGITRGILAELAGTLDIPFLEKSITPYDIYVADECFLSGTGAELIPVREVSGRKIPQSPGPVYLALKQAFTSALDDSRFFDD